MGSPDSEGGRNTYEIQHNENQHVVSVSRGFYLGVSEVTQEQYKSVMGDDGSYFKGLDRPVEQVSWDEAVEFCRLLSAREDRTYRLPTEAEWEYACRAGSTTRYSFGDDPAGLGDHAWFIENSSGATHPVGGKLPNPWGLYDMHGNVWEWCADWYEADYYANSPPNDPIGPATGLGRVYRGGGWEFGAAGCRSAYRAGVQSDFRYFNTGFRIAAVLLAGPSPEQQTAAKRLGRPVIAANSIGMKLTLIPAGEFQMGSPAGEEGRDSDEQQHRVRITKPFYLGVCEVTQEQYEHVMGNNPSNFKGPTHPVETVSWEDSVAFCDKLSTLREEKAAGRKYRLPTEAEWEHACRADRTTRYSFGDDPAGLGEHAWFDGNSAQTPHPVGEKHANPWGLYDMHGNVWEWCADWYDKGYYTNSPVDDPTGPPGGLERVGRGGGWHCPPSSCRSARRGWNPPALRFNYIGFRVAADLPAGPASESASGSK